jgi:transposase-like protein
VAKLTDKEKKKIIADYIETQNYCETGRINNVDESTVRRIVKDENNEDITKLTEQKKQENTNDILKYMDEIYDKQKKIIDLSLSALEEKLQKPDMFTNVKDIATVYGVIFDKALKYKEMKIKNNEQKDGIKAKIEIINDLGGEHENKS